MKNKTKAIVAGIVLLVLVVVSVLIYNNNTEETIDPCRGSANAECILSEMPEMNLSFRPGVNEVNAIDKMALGFCTRLESNYERSAIIESNVEYYPQFSAEVVSKLFDLSVYVYCPQEAK